MPYERTNIQDLKSDNKAALNSVKADEESKGIDKRIQRRMNRESIRDAKDTNMVINSANKQGIDINNLGSRLPVSDKYKKGLSDKLSNQVKEEDKGKLTSFVGSITDPNYASLPTVDVEEEKRKARIQRKSAWTGALSAFGSGLQGKNFNHDNTASSRIQRDRDEQFQNFKTISEANKQTSSNWQYNSRKEALDWIDKQLASDAVGDAEKKKYAAMQAKLTQDQKQYEDDLGFKNKELAARERMAKDKNKTQSKDDKRKMSSATEQYYKLSGNSPKALAEFAKYSGAPIDENGNVDLRDSDYERYATSLLGQMFTTDAEGNMIPKPGKENFINEINDKIAAKESIPQEIKRLEEERDMKKEDNFFLAPDSKINEEYDPQIQKLVDQLETADQDIKALFGGKSQKDPLDLGL